MGWIPGPPSSPPSPGLGFCGLRRHLGSCERAQPPGVSALETRGLGFQGKTRYFQAWGGTARAFLLPAVSELRVPARHEVSR